MFVFSSFYELFFLGFFLDLLYAPPGFRFIYTAAAVIIYVLIYEIKIGTIFYPKKFR